MPLAGAINGLNDEQTKPTAAFVCGTLFSPMGASSGRKQLAPLVQESTSGPSLTRDSNRLVIADFVFLETTQLALASHFIKLKKTTRPTCIVLPLPDYVLLLITIR